MKSARQHRPGRPAAPVSASTRKKAAALLLFVIAGCATSHQRRPRTLAAVGASMAVAGSGLWVVGEQRSNPGSLPAIGLGVVAVGIVAMVAAGGWIAAQVSCQADPDCEGTEECKEIPAPPGGIPYKQCMSR